MGQRETLSDLKTGQRKNPPTSKWDRRAIPLCPKTVHLLIYQGIAGLQARETFFQKGERGEKSGEKLHISAQSLHNRFMVNL
jgi:hypothetical protein